MADLVHEQVARMKYTRSDFPDTFHFGLAATDPGPEAQTRGLDSFQFPIPWHAVLPQGRGQPDEAELDRIERLTNRLLARGLRPCAVLDATALPPELDDLGGWRNRDVASWFADFGEIVAARLGGQLYSMAPMLTVDTAPNPDKRFQARSLHHRLLAHGNAIQAMRGLGLQNLGVEINLNDPEYGAFLAAIFDKTYPQDLHDRLGAHLPNGWDQGLAVIAAPVDWLGVLSRHPNDLVSLTSLSLQHNPCVPVQVTVIAEDETDLADQFETIHNTLFTLSMSGVSVQTGNPAVLGSLQSALTSAGLPTPWVPPTGTMHDHWNLIADVGGTNTRLGVVTNGDLTELHRYPTGTLEDLRAALNDVRDAVGTDPRAVVAAGAGPVRDGIIHLTNAQVALSEAELARATGARRTFVINDFTAAAWSVADITSADVAVLQGAETPPAGTRLVVGPGTGLGVGALLYSEGHYHTVSGEGGHMGLSPRHRDEVEVFAAARHIAPDCFFDDSLALEAEMFLSGTGLPVLYQAICMAEGQDDMPVRTAKDILQDAKDGTDACAVKAARMFTEHLGAIMGDLSVALIPAGGVFLVGGVAEKKPLAVWSGLSERFQCQRSV